jgi:TonB family protein
MDAFGHALVGNSQLKFKEAAMKTPTLVLFIACATAAAAAESPPTDIPAILPRYAFKPQVEDYYPSTSRTMKEQGTTEIRLCYDVQGRPNEVTVGESSRFARLDEAALRWGKAMRITPGLYGGRPQPACVKIPVKFSLEKSQEPPDWREEWLLPPVEVEVPPILIDVPPPPPPGMIPGYPGRFIPL